MADQNENGSKHSKAFTWALYVSLSIVVYMGLGFTYFQRYGYRDPFKLTHPARDWLDPFFLPLAPLNDLYEVSKYERQLLKRTQGTWFASQVYEASPGENTLAATFRPTFFHIKGKTVTITPKDESLHTTLFPSEQCQLRKEVGCYSFTCEGGIVVQLYDGPSGNGFVDVPVLRGPEVFHTRFTFSPAISSEITTP